MVTANTEAIITGENNTPPQIPRIISDQDRLTRGRRVSFRASTWDRDGDNLRYTWGLPNKQIIHYSNPQVSSDVDAQDSVSHIFLTAGIHIINLAIFDGTEEIRAVPLEVMVHAE